MNPEKAARRLCCYWKERRKYFGPDKYCLPMTLRGAMRDEHAVIKSGFARILPGLDDFGRQVSFIIMRNHTRDGYTSESLIRYLFYHQEVLCNHKNAAKGTVRLYSYKNFSLWENDSQFYKTVTDLQKVALPVPARANHNIFMPFFLRNIVQPINRALLDKETRARIVVHDVSESQVVEALSDYGIQAEMIPTELGGTSNYSHSQWIADRYAAES